LRRRAGRFRHPESQVARKVRKKLGEILVEAGHVTAQQVESAVAAARSSGRRVGEALVEAGACKEEHVAKALADQFGVEFLNLDRPENSNRIDMALMPEDLAKKYLVLPLQKQGGRLKLLIHDPMDLETLDLLRFRLNSEIDTAIAPRSQIEAHLAGSGGGGGSAASGMLSKESLVTDSVDVTVDKSVDTSIDSSIDVDA
jgi:type IV pilus assembly protein PilB